MARHEFALVRPARRRTRCGMKWMLLALTVVVATRLLKKPTRALRRQAICRWRIWFNRGYWARHRVVAGRPARVRMRVSLTTSPDRIAHIEPVLASLMEGQTVRAEAVQVNIPHVFERTGQGYVIPDFIARRGVIVHRCEDLGPATKIVPTLRGFAAEEDAWAVAVDDDVRYLPELLATLEAAILREPTAGHGISCWEPELTLVEGGPGIKAAALEGVAGYALHRSFLKADFDEYFACALRNKNCRFQDDFTLGNYLALHGIARRSAADAKVNPRRMRRMGCHLPQGFGWDALHLGSATGVPNELRYTLGLRYLEQAGWRGYGREGAAA
jgi:hypothetical protein